MHKVQTSNFLILLKLFAFISQCSHIQQFHLLLSQASSLEKPAGQVFNLTEFGIHPVCEF